LLSIHGMTSSIVKLDDGLVGPDSTMAVDPDAAAGDRVDNEMEPDRAQLSSGSSENLSAREHRVMKKAHRSAKNGGTESAENGVQQTGGGQNGVSKQGASVTHKNNRRRRHARGRVQLKKGNRLIKRRVSGPGNRGCGYPLQTASSLHSSRGL